MINSIFSGNVFKIDVGGLVYDVDPKQIGFHKDFVALSLTSSSALRFTGNIFSGNNLNVTSPWIRFAGNQPQGTTCLAGNRLCFTYTSTVHVSETFLCPMIAQIFKLRVCCGQNRYHIVCPTCTFSKCDYGGQRLSCLWTNRF